MKNDDNKLSSIPKFHIAKKKNFKVEQHGPLERYRWDQMPRRSKHPLSTGRTHRVLIVRNIRRNIIKYKNKFLIITLSFIIFFQNFFFSRDKKKKLSNYTSFRIFIVCQLFA